MSEPFSAVNREKIREISGSRQASLTANMPLTRITGKLSVSEFPDGTGN